MGVSHRYHWGSSCRRNQQSTQWKRRCRMMRLLQHGRWAGRCRGAGHRRCATPTRRAAQPEPSAAEPQPIRLPCSTATFGLAWPARACVARRASAHTWSTGRRHRNDARGALKHSGEVQEALIDGQIYYRLVDTAAHEPGVKGSPEQLRARIDQDVVSFLEHLPLFRVLTAEQIARSCRGSMPSNSRRDYVLLWQGAVNEQILLVKNGILRITQFSRLPRRRIPWATSSKARFWRVQRPLRATPNCHGDCGRPERC